MPAAAPTEPPTAMVTASALRTADGVALCGERWAHRPGLAPVDPGAVGPRPVVVVAHGFAAGRADPAVLRLATDLFAAGFDVLRYDARGHGGSGGRCSVGAREDLDVAAAAEWAAAGGAPVVLLGVSMGAVAVTSYLAGNGGTPSPAVAGGVLVSGPSRWRMRPSPVGLISAVLTRTGPGRRVAARHLGVRIAADWEPGEPPEAGLARVAVPVAVVHGAADRLLGPVHGRRLRAAAGGPCRLEIVPDMGHGIDDAARPVAVAQARWILARAGWAGTLRSVAG